MGPKKIEYPPMKAVKVVALAITSHGHKAHPPSKTTMNCPRLIFTYFGNKAVKSFAAEIELADILIPI